MMLELHNVTIGQQQNSVSLTISDGQLASIAGAEGSGKTSLLRAVLGFIPISGGHICIDGELLTPESAPWFRRMMAYVPQRLSLPDGCRDVPTDYLELLRRAVTSGKQLLIVDEPPYTLSGEQQEQQEALLREALAGGAAVLAVKSPICQNEIAL